MRLSIVRAVLCTLAALALLGPLPAPAIELDAISKAAAGYQTPDAKLETLYRAALLNTSKQITVADDGTAYVKTGDIPAEWLRDASAQVRPYLFFAKDDPQVRTILRGIIARMGRYLHIDPYANAFTLNYRVWEQKFELDSLAYPITLAWTYWKQTGDTSIFTGDLSLGFDSALDTMEREQDHPRNSRYTHKELPDGGKGKPVAYTGMIWSGFRPSDDACNFNYLIPSEMMAVVALGELEEIERDVYHNLIKTQRAAALRTEVQTGIQTYGVVFTPNYGYVYAYEVDGMGNSILMDDANIPSLLSAPYLGYTKSSSFIYKNTRKFLLSKDNPTYYVGKLARGIGSPHTNDGWVWPLAMLMEGFTASSDGERKDVLNELLASDPGDHLLHEAFNPDDPTKFSRVDFGWPNALFSEWVMTSFEGVPALPVGSTSDLDFRGD
ncbi:glycoside hydrolase family 125 protein [Vulcanimicrobium alpinum]|uniref:glycoside hydrolase family 125 protein n=1 Tax=Vulcanimicrobium alpinum TaxID=3016050 RepID=UPI00295E238A|nr:glycoside hydrolase family 125 protein [Vulcanimicrobium alpinum]